MKKLIFIFVMISMTILPYTVFGADISVKELIENAERFDGDVVTVKGEAIGDIMQRKDKQLVNILDNGTAIGVWSSKDMNFKEEIGFVGSYKAKGDLVQVAGVFNRACGMHGGDIDIHANEIKIIKKGERLRYSVDIRRAQIAVLLFAAAALALVFNYLRSRKYL